MSQVTITNFFSKRKRQIEDLKTRSKVLVLEREVSGSFNIVKPDADKSFLQQNFVKVDSETSPNHHEKHKLQLGSASTGKQKVVRFDESKNTRVKIFGKRCSFKSKGGKYDIRKSFQKATTKVPDASSGGENDSEVDDPHPEEPVVVEEATVLPQNAVLPTEGSSVPALGVCGSEVQGQAESNFLIPTENGSQVVAKEHSATASVLPENAVLPTESSSDPKAGVGSSGVDERSESSLMTPTKNCEETESVLMSPKKKASQDMSLSEIKSRLSRSEKLRQAISSFSKAAARCKRLEAARRELDRTGPQLQNFEKVEVEFPTSPQKRIARSPEKRPVVSSPRKVSELPLPFNFRGLAEVFRCVDVVVSMLYNRSEVVTFKKVKAAVQEMMHKTFTEQHLGQIKSVFPDAYIYHQGKVRNFGSTSKADAYELTITPVLVNGGKNESCTAVSGEDISKPTEKLTMTPASILDRKRSFYNKLLERVFEKHEKFLSSLDPPLMIAREDLVRWHPQFEIDAVEEIVPHELPQPPNVKKFTSARDVLDRAKDLISCNRRLQCALQEVSGSVSQSGSLSAVSTDNVISPSKQDAVHSALKGIPKSLLEKVRARQAAKARLAMTCPAPDQESIEHSRLPELARIMRNLFVIEKKVTLPLDLAVLKLQNSYREKLSARELERHIKLMVELLPGWIAIYSIRNVDYLKLSRNGDMTKVIHKLEATALEKSNNIQVLKPA